MNVREAMKIKLQAALAPENLAIENESHKHAHHREVMEGGPAAQSGQTHFRIVITAGAFAGKSRVERHRMIYELLDSEIKGGVHALAIKAVAPGEAI